MMSTPGNDEGALNDAIVQEESVPAEVKMISGETVKKQEREASPKGKVGKAMRREATTLSKGRAMSASQRESKLGRQGRKGSFKVKRSLSMGGASAPRRGSNQADTISPTKVPRFKKAATLDLPSGEGQSPPGKGFDRFKKQGSFRRQGSISRLGSFKGSVTGTTDLFDDDDDPEDADYPPSSLTLSNLVSTKPSVALPLGSHSTRSSCNPKPSLAMPLGLSGHTRSIHQSATRPTISDDELSDDSLSVDLSHMIGPSNKYLQDFGVGTKDVPPPTSLSRESSANNWVAVSLMGQSLRNVMAANEPDNLKPTGFFARLMGGGKVKAASNPSTLGSTALAGFGKKYQVDQSVNLMDVSYHEDLESLQSQSLSSQRSTISQCELAGSREGSGSTSERRRKRRKSAVQKAPENSFFSKLKTKCLGWDTGLICLALAGAIGLILSLVLYGSMTSPLATDVPTAAPATATPEPTNPASASPSPAPEDAKDQLSLAERERWEDLVGLFSQSGLTPREEFDDPNSSAYKALDWIVAYDSGMEYISTDESTQLLEHYALMVFYFATHPNAQPQDSDPHLTMDSPENETYDPKNDWIHHAATPPCHWQGVHCGHLKRVVVLNLTHHELEGTLPGELKALGHLIDFDLSHNKIGGTLPPAYGELEHLQLINMRDNRLEGTFPEEWQALPRLETLDLNENPGLEAVPSL